MRLLISILLVMFALHGNAQVQLNLVADGSFEQNTGCPSGLSQTNLCSWTLPLNHSGSSDYFHTCGTGGGAVPSNTFATNVPPFQGEAYAGGYTGGNFNPTYREYLVDTLLNPLVAGQAYVVSFYFHNAQTVQYTSDDIGFLLTDTMPAAGSGGSLGFLGVPPTSQNTSGNFYTSTNQWYQYIDTIVANGGEQFITVGAFDSIPNLLLIDSNANIGAAYRFYDSVSIYVLGFTALNHCLGESQSFSINIDTATITAVNWDFGDPASGANNTSSQFNPSHTFSDTGSYTVTLIIDYGTGLDTVSQTVQVYPFPTLDLGPDTALCVGDSLTLSVSQRFATFLWDDGSTQDSVVVQTTGTYAVTVFGFCDTLVDSIFVRFDEEIDFDFGPDTAFCEGDSMVLDADINVFAQIFWNTGDSTDRIVVTESGFYEMNALNACGPVIDNITVEVYANPDSVVLPPDTINCFDNVITLSRPNSEGVEYYWSDSTQRREYEVDTTETVWLAAISECGLSVDTINIIFNGEIKTELGEDTMICDEDTILLQGIDSLATYVWNTGDTADSVWTVLEASQNYIVTITLKDCQRIEQRFVESNELACPSIDCDIEASNIFTPNGDGINDLFRLTTDCDVFSYDLFIYNRWGQLVHSSRNKNFGWDGFVNGEPASEGVYYYIVEYRDQVVVDADRRETKGSFTLLRD